MFRVLKTAGLSELAKRLDGVNYVHSDYSDPAKKLSLPFPYIDSAPSDRFTISDDGAFTYIGRECFSQVYEAVKAFNYTAGIRHIYLKGTMGFGKSHVLAAIAVKLLKEDKRVVYIPDCALLISKPVRVLSSALYLAIRDNEEMMRGISKASSVNELTIIARRFPQGQLYFIIDQMNAFRSCSDWAHASDLITSLEDVSSNHFKICSASGNYEDALRDELRATHGSTIMLYGGFSSVPPPIHIDFSTKADTDNMQNEMEHWWKAAGLRIRLCPEDQATLAELTGGSALLLRPLTRIAAPNENDAYKAHRDHVFDQFFASEEVCSMLRRIPEFARRMRSGPRKDECVFTIPKLSRHDM